MKTKLLYLGIVGGLCLSFGTSLFADSLEQTQVTSQILLSTSDSNHTSILDSYESIDELLLPRNLYILQGDASNLERYNIFFRNIVIGELEDYNVSAYSDYGKALTGRWHFQSLSEQYNMPTEPFNLSFFANKGNTYMSASTTVEIVETNDETPVRLLAIGDSLTRAGIYLSQIEAKLPNVTTVGTRTYPDADYPREGRGGWTLEKYFTFINSDVLDSPFLFPKNISGDQYKGNTADWKKICYTHSNDHTYNGFQKIARGWLDDGEYLYDENGYYKYPEIGDVMVDPTLPQGSEWVEWNGNSWTPMTLQPTTFEFNFSKYIERFASAFADGAPTHVSILLGSNDFGFFDTFNGIELFIERLNIMIDSIHQFDPNIKVIICTPPLGPSRKYLSQDYVEKYIKYDRNMKLATYHLLKAFDNDESLSRNILVAPMTLTLDVTNGFDFKEKVEIIDGVSKTTIIPGNGIHPSNSYGQLQMGDTLAAVIQKYR